MIKVLIKPFHSCIKPKIRPYKNETSNWHLKRPIIEDASLIWYLDTPGGTNSGSQPQTSIIKNNPWGFTQKYYTSTDLMITIFLTTWKYLKVKKCMSKYLANNGTSLWADSVGASWYFPFHCSFVVTWKTIEDFPTYTLYVWTHH